MSDTLRLTYIYILLLCTYVSISLDTFLDTLILIYELTIIKYQSISINPPSSPYVKIMGEIATIQIHLKALLMLVARAFRPLDTKSVCALRINTRTVKRTRI